MELHYQNIAQIVLASCPANSSKAWVSAEVKDDWSKQQIWCEGEQGKSQPDIDALAVSRIGDDLRAIRTQMTVPGQAPWSRCTFTLFPDGKFKFDVEYDD